MKCEQICDLLLQTTQKWDLQGRTDRLDSFEVDPSNLSDEDITSKLYKILQSLQDQKNDFILTEQKQHLNVIEKINTQKDLIIEELLKSIYNLKKQNEQLRFQYRKRFKVIKNIEEKYKNLIMGKNKKINELDSVVKYLEGKIKHLQKKLAQFQNQMRKKISSSKGYIFSKSPQNYLTPNKISVIISKEKLKSDLQRNFLTKNSLEDLARPMASSFLSVGKEISSSKTICRNQSKGKYGQNCVSNFGYMRESDMYSSFLTPSENNLNEKCIETETNFEENSRMVPTCLDNHHSVSTSKYLDFNDLETNDIKSVEDSINNSQRTSHCISRDRWSFLKQKQ